MVFFEYWFNHLNQLKGFEKGLNEGTEIEVMQDIVLKELYFYRGQSISEEKKKLLTHYFKKLNIEGNIEDILTN